MKQVVQSMSTCSKSSCILLISPLMHRSKNIPNLSAKTMSLTPTTERLLCGVELTAGCQRALQEKQLKFIRLDTCPNMFNERVLLCWSVPYLAQHVLSTESPLRLMANTVITFGFDKHRLLFFFFRLWTKPNSISLDCKQWLLLVFEPLVRWLCVFVLRLTVCDSMWDIKGYWRQHLRFIAFHWGHIKLV